MRRRAHAHAQAPASKQGRLSLSIKAPVNLCALCRAQTGVGFRPLFVSVSFLLLRHLLGPGLLITRREFWTHRRDQTKLGLDPHGHNRISCHAHIFCRRYILPARSERGSRVKKSRSFCGVTLANEQRAWPCIFVAPHLAAPAQIHLRNSRRHRRRHHCGESTLEFQTASGRMLENVAGINSVLS